MSLSTDGELVADAYAFVQAVGSHPRNPELAHGCRRLAELALAGRAPEADSRLLAAVRGLHALKLRHTLSRVRARVVDPTAFPETVKLLDRLGIAATDR